MLQRLAESASLDAREIIKGRSLRRCALAAMQTAVSVIPLAILASVFPVQGLMIKASRQIRGPSGSASTMV